MDKDTHDRIAAFEDHMSFTPVKLARGELETFKRWTLLEAVGFTGCGDDKLVRKIREWCSPFNALPHHQAAVVAAAHISKYLEIYQPASSGILSFEDAVRALLSDLHAGHITAYVDNLPTSLEGLTFRELDYTSNMIGLSPTPAGDSRYWQSVHVNSAHVRLARDRAVGINEVQPVRSIPEPEQIRPLTSFEAKRGPKPKWDWFNLMGEIVRIADQDGLATWESQSALEKWATDWLAKAAGNADGPSESLVRQHIAPIYDAVDRENAKRLREKAKGR